MTSNTTIVNLIDTLANQHLDILLSTSPPAGTPHNSTMGIQAEYPPTHPHLNSSTPDADSKFTPTYSKPTHEAPALDLSSYQTLHHPHYTTPVQTCKRSHHKNIPSHLILPTPESLLCDFATSFAGKIAGKTVSAKCDGICAWHIQNGFPYLGSTQLNYVIHGIENQRPDSSKRPDHPPVTLNMLWALESKLDFTSPAATCIYFLALCCFWGQIRLGELLPESEGAFNPKLYPTWSELRATISSHGSGILHLPNTKMGSTKGEDIIITHQHVADPIVALDIHYLMKLFRKEFSDCLLCVPPDIVKILGCWSSDAFLRYWCSLELIAPLYVKLLTPILRDCGLLRLPAS
ncbi:hypothetical protein C0995_015687 [Termitomyces sp. Mi166|nr:hypothetical protein C0995_015687 [Termitomyces sp. Mi166\